jgi:hypothetical protein
MVAVPAHRLDEDRDEIANRDAREDVVRGWPEQSDSGLRQDASIDREPVRSHIARIALRLDRQRHPLAGIQVELEVGRRRPRARGIEPVDHEL